MKRLGRLISSLALGLGLAGAARGAPAMSGAEDAKLEKQIPSEGARRLAVDVAEHTNGVRRVDDELVPAPN